MTIAERIALLPEAVNIAKPFHAELTQRKSSSQSETKRAADITEISRLRSSLYAVDAAEYSKASAVNKQWRKMNTVNLLDILDGKADTSNRTLSEKELEKRLQQEGLLDEVNDTDFQMLKFEFSGIRFEPNAVDSSIFEGVFHKNVEYLASRYAAMEDRIKDICTGEKQKEWLNKLDELYQSTLERSAKEYADIVGGLLENCGVSGEREKIYLSFKSGVEERVSEYREFLKSNEDFIGLSGSKDAWLLKDDEYVAARLREQNIVSADHAGNEAYSLRDLDVLGQYVSGLSSVMAKADTYQMNEERIGLELAVLAMKTDTLTKRGSVSSGLCTTLKEAFQGYINAFLEQFEQKLSINRAQALISSDGRGNAGLDRKSIWDVYNKTMESYHASGDAVQALIRGAQYGKAQYAEKMQQESTRSIYRYKNGSEYWNRFFESSSRGKGDGYRNAGTTYEKYIRNWMDFSDSLSEDRSVRMNALLRSMESCSIGCAGNQVNERA